jgi:hypothetical protein
MARKNWPNEVYAYPETPIRITLSCTPATPVGDTIARCKTYSSDSANCIRETCAPKNRIIEPNGECPSIQFNMLSWKGKGNPRRSSQMCAQVSLASSGKINDTLHSTYLQPKTDKAYDPTDTPLHVGTIQRRAPHILPLIAQIRNHFGFCTSFSKHYKHSYKFEACRWPVDWQTWLQSQGQSFSEQLPP